MSTGNPPLPGTPPSPAPDTSSMRLVTAATGAVRRRVTVGSRFFGEGSTRVRDRLAMISWKAGTGWLFDPNTLAQLGTWAYAGEGWGIAWDGDAAVYLSNGSSTIQVFHASNYTAGVPLRTVAVTNGGLPIARLNELEVVCGELWANVWLTTVLVRIDPATGVVVGTVDMRGLLTRMVAGGVFDEAKRRSGGAVLNGIAWDRGGAGGGHAKADAPTLWVTGKWWPRVFEVTVDDPAVDWGKCAGLPAAGLP
ncbi:hypothetical protein BU14_0442s0026 [Porphyra umbilicalis]|uniref:Glutamine cyclotransferase n=1 Tax=Porphyra umbilicalis TaxID=2786 RepID=A0A1X6NUV7_PORUM|nr:hypothetical protein BU14_0442s0026 [Porphyra umbilicalis]|eukprot:OSX72391.1 hypothetical protein BU14_0442s0026 [Porphyra umbilicalis]